MTEVLPASDADPAGWLLDSGVDWWTLVRYGPPAFEIYVRIALPAVGGHDEESSDAAVLDPVRATLVVLAAHTTTPANAYAAVWEGWGGAPNPRAPRVEIPNRAMLLFTGPVHALRDAPAVAWYGSATAIWQEPHLVWPEDHAWCLACDVDEEIEFTVGCSRSASRALIAGLPGAVRPTRYGEPAPLYRDER